MRAVENSYTLKIVSIGNWVEISSLIRRIIDTDRSFRCSAYCSASIIEKAVYITQNTVHVKIIDNIISSDIDRVSIDGIIICFDITQRSSYDNIQNLINTARRDTEWNNKDILEHSVLLGLKTNLTPREVTNEEAIEFANKHKLSYYEVSTLSGNSASLFCYDYLNSIIMRNISFKNPAIFPDTKRLNNICKKTWLSAILK